MPWPFSRREPGKERKPVNITNVAMAIIAALFLIQILSLLISSIFPSVGVIKGGNAILLMILGIGMITLFITGSRFEEIDIKQKLTFIIIVFALVALAYWKLPTLLPQIFSIEPGISQTIKQTVGSIFGGF